MRDAHLYADLAAIGRANGYPVTAAAVHLWTNRHLLPGHIGDRPGPDRRRTALRSDAMDRLLAICRFRFNGGVSRLDWIGALLWLDGAAISTSFIRDALRREAERPNLKPLPRGDKLDRIAIKVGRLGIVRESAPTLAPVDREGLALRVMEAVQGATTLSDELMANLCAAFDVTPEEIESFLQGLSAPGVGSVASVVEAADDYYELARQRWLTDWHQPKESRSRKGRVRFRRTLYGFLQCLLSLQLSPGTLGPGEPK